MAEKVIRQQPVAWDHVSRMVFLNFHQAIDAETYYQPVDETGTVIGEVRMYREHFTGPDLQRLIEFLTAELLPDVNDAEGTGEMRAKEIQP